MLLPEPSQPVPTVPSRRWPAPASSSAAASVTRCATSRRSRWPIVLPVMLMLLFTFVFGGALDSGGDYVQLRRARHHPAVRGLRCVQHRGRCRPGHERRDRGPLPHHAAPLARGHHRPRRRQPAAQPPGDRRRDRRRPAGGVPPDRRISCSGWAPSAWSRCSSSRSRGCTRRSDWPRRARRRRAATASRCCSCRTCPAPSCRPTPCRRWLQWVAENQPITPIIETIRALLFGRDPGADLWWALGWCALIIAAAYVWAAWLFRRWPPAAAESARRRPSVQAAAQRSAVGEGVDGVAHAVGVEGAVVALREVVGVHPGGAGALDVRERVVEQDGVLGLARRTARALACRCGARASGRRAPPTPGRCRRARRRSPASARAASP